MYRHFTRRVFFLISSFFSRKHCCKSNFISRSQIFTITKLDIFIGKLVRTRLYNGLGTVWKLCLPNPTNRGRKFSLDWISTAWIIHQVAEQVIYIIWKNYCLNMGQTRTRVAWELTSESLHESFINSHVLVKREQELHDSWQTRVLHESFIISNFLVKREEELTSESFKCYQAKQRNLISWSVSFFVAVVGDRYVWSCYIQPTVMIVFLIFWTMSKMTFSWFWIPFLNARRKLQFFPPNTGI